MRVSEPGIQESPDLRGGWSGLGPGNSAPVTEFCIFPPSPALCSVTRGHPESTGVAPAPIPGTMWQGQQITAAPHPAWSFCLVAPPVSPNVTDSYSPIKTQLRLYLESFWLPHHQAGGGAGGLITPRFLQPVGWAHVCLPYGALDSPTRSLAPSANRD